MRSVVRIVDAAANRARESLRVLEDIARFVLDDRVRCEQIKQLRHDLRIALESLSPDTGRRLAERDTAGDVGTSVTVPTESTRAGVREVALAAAGRLSEALRSLEESAKVLGDDGGVIESLRYRAYELEKHLVPALGSGRAVDWRLCVLLSERLCLHMGWEAVAEASIEGGADCLQLREKGLSDAELLRRAERLVAIGRSGGGRSGGVGVVINDRIDVALVCGADGVHLGSQDMPVDRARVVAGDQLLIGASTATVEQARAAVRAGADVCGVGPMFATTTKAIDSVRGPQYLREYLADPVVGDVPHLAIGGIGPDNASRLCRSGCRGLAVSASVCSSPEPAAVCATLLETVSTAVQTG